MESFPPAMHLTSNNVTNWEHYLDDKLTAFPDVGQAIRNKTPFVLTKPTINDLFEDTNVRMYNLQVDDPTALTDSSLSNFLKANAAFKKDDKERRDEEAKVCHCTSSYPPSLKKHVCYSDQFQPSRKLSTTTTLMLCIR